MPVFHTLQTSPRPSLIFSEIAAGAPPTETTKVSDTVTNVVIGLDTTVSELILDPDAAPGTPRPLPS